MEKKWSKLIALIGVPLDERRRFQTMADDHNYHCAIKESIQWWIENGTNVTWNELISAIQHCGDSNVAINIMREIDIGKFYM